MRKILRGSCQDFEILPWHQSRLGQPFVGVVPEPEEEEEAAPADVTASTAPPEENNWIRFLVIDDATTEPVEGAQIKVKLPDGTVEGHKTDSAGMVRISDIPAGTCDIERLIDVKGYVVVDFDGTACDAQSSAKKYSPQDGDTLEKIAERETAAGNEMTWQSIAKFNWGTEDVDDINEHLRDELGCRKRDEANNFVVSSDDEPQGELLLPVGFQKSGLATGKSYTIWVRRKECPPQFLECCSIPGVTFEFDKSFVRPTVVDHIQKLEDAIAKYPDAKIMIFGHTDKVGPDAYNKKLSERRAKSVYAFITDDAGVWEDLYKEEKWGTKVVQMILKDFGDPYDPGPVDGKNGPRTTAAIKEYQKAQGLKADGVAGPQTREKMFLEYMTGKHDVELKPEQFMEPQHMGCGEFNPMKATEKAHEPNRRVTFYLFHPERLPKLPCKASNTGPCKKQMDPPKPRHSASFRCSFYDSIARRCPCEGGGPIVELPALRIDLEIEQKDSKLQDDKYTLFCSDDESIYKKTLTVKDDHVPEDEFLTLEFLDLISDRPYTLEVEPGTGAECYRLFEQVPLEELLSGKYAYPGSGEEPEEEDSEIEQIYDDSEDAELPYDDDLSDEEQQSDDWEPEEEA